MAEAIANIRERPGCYLKNIAANISRLFFSFPYSYTRQKMTTLFYLLPNVVLLSFLWPALCVVVRSPRKRLTALYPYLLFAAVTLGGTALLSAYARMLFPVVPALLLVIIYGLREVRLESPTP